jgi:hypothetical protein
MWPELERHLAGFFESLLSVGTFSPLASKEQSLLTSLAAPQSKESGVRRKIRVNFGLRCGWSTLTLQQGTAANFVKESRSVRVKERGLTKMRMDAEMWHG